MRSFRQLRKADHAVSPVIAVILMVAITVVLAATIYVWVSGFGGSAASSAKSVAVASNGALSGGAKSYTVSAATPGLRWADFAMSIDGAAINQTHAATDGSYLCPSASEASTRFLVCANGLTKRSNATLEAGDLIRLAGVSAGQTLRLIDAQGNSVVLSMAVS